MATSSFKDYPEGLYLSKEDLDDNNSLLKILNLVGQGKKVIDFGCATGYLAKLLVDEGCEVVGVELNPNAAAVAEQHCTKVIVADLDYQSIDEIVGDEKFDVAVFGDVLEHLRDPWKVLKAVSKILNSQGYVIASIPNVAHGSIRLALLEGRFEYSDLGLLDNTHLRFFTKETVHSLFEQTGYFIEAEDCTRLPIFDASPLSPNVDQEKFPAELLESICKDANSEILQFIVRAYPYSTAHEQGFIKKKYEQVKADLVRSTLDLEKTQVALEQVRIEFQRTQADLLNTQAKLQRAESELQQVHGELRQSQEQSQHLQGELRQSQEQFQHVQGELRQSQEQSQILMHHIQAMESSKFWKLRRVFFYFKRGFKKIGRGI